MDGGKAELVCRVVGRPMPVCTVWSRDAKTLEIDSAQYTASYDQQTGHASLAIVEVFPEDAGLYRCFAENEYGQATTEARLVVEGTSDDPSTDLTTIIVIIGHILWGHSGPLCHALSLIHI